MAYEMKGYEGMSDPGLKTTYDQIIYQWFNDQRKLMSMVPSMAFNDAKYTWLARYDRNPTAGAASSPLDSIVGDTSLKIELTGKLAVYKVAVMVEDLRDIVAKNTGIGALSNTWSSEMQYAMEDLYKQLNTDYYGAHTTADYYDQVNGLRNLIDATGTIFGVDRTLYAGLIGNEDNAVGDLTLAKLRAYIVTLLDNGADVNNLAIFTTNTIKSYILGKMESNKMYLGTSARAGFEGDLMFDGVPIHADSDCTSGFAFILDMSSIKRVYLFEPRVGEDLDKDNLTKTKYIWTCQNMFITRGNTHYKLGAITS